MIDDWLVDSRRQQRTPSRGKRKRNAAGRAESSELFLSSTPLPQCARVVLPPGTPLGRFKILAELGHGAGSAVFMAEDLVRHERVALKIIDIGPWGAQAQAQLLRREMRLHALLADHRYVVQAHDLHEVAYGGSVLLILSMEFADGGSFRQWLVDHRSDPDYRRTEGLRLFKEACCGVSTLHDAGIIHRDLKPENFEIVRGVLKVADLELARGPVGTRGRGAGGADEIPGPVGTLEYMSPEQIRGVPAAQLDARTDIYALSIILYELVDPDGARPFRGTDAQLRFSHLRGPAPMLSGIAPTIAEAIVRGLQKNAADRQQDVQEFVDSLEGRLRDRPDLRVRTAELWTRARECARKGKLNGALCHCRELLALHPEHVEGKRLLAELEERYLQAGRLYGMVEHDMGSRGVLASVALIREATTLFPEHAAGQTLLHQLRSKALEYAQCMRHARNALERGYLDAALSELQKAQRLNPGAPHPAQLIEAISRVRDQIHWVHGYIDQSLSDGKRGRARRLTDALDRYVARSRPMLVDRAARGGT